MKKKYSVLGSGVLTLSFVGWLLVVSVLAAVAILFITLGGASMDMYMNYLVVVALPEILLIVPLIVYMAVTKTGFRALMGNRTTLSQNLLAVLAGVLLAPALTGFGTVLDWLFRLLGAHPLDTSKLNPLTLGQMFVSMFAVGVLAGVVEEPIFRGAVLRGMGSAAGKRTAVLLSALVFAAVHGDVVGLLPRFLMGLVLGYMAWRAGAVLPGVCLHVAYNSTLMAIVYFLRDWPGFKLFPGATADVNGLLTWMLLAVPFTAAAYGAYRLFARATPESAAWSPAPYERRTKSSHFVPWIIAGAVLLALMAFSAAIMFLPVNDLTRQFADTFK
jgi:membrane protease YdiL (CAAX protease family)